MGRYPKQSARMTRVCKHGRGTNGPGLSCTDRPYRLTAKRQAAKNGRGSEETIHRGATPSGTHINYRGSVSVGSRGR